MNLIARRFMSLIAAVLLLFSFVGAARASLVISAAPAPGTDLSNVHVGDTLQFITYGSSSVPGAGEHLLSFPDIHIFYTANLDFISGVGQMGWDSSLDTNPALVLWTMQVNAAGIAGFYNGFSDCNGLPNDTSGCAVTDLGATRPADSNFVVFNVQAVPEPSSIALLAVALLAARVGRRRS